MLDLVPLRPRFEGPVIAFFVVAVAAYAVLLWWSWSAALVEAMGSEAEVADTGLAC